MRQVNINQLKAILSREVKTLPFEITKRGKVIAVVSSPNHTGSVINHTGSAPTTVVQNVITSKKQNNPAPQVIEPQDKINTPDKYDNKGKFKTYFKKPVVIKNQLNSPGAVKDWHKNKFNNKKKVKTFFK